MNALRSHSQGSPVSPLARTEPVELLSFLGELSDEVEDAFDIIAPNAHLRMALHLLQGHFEARTITPTSLIGSSRVPYATANRRMREMIADGLIEQRPRTRTGKSFSMHPSDKLLAQWMQLSGRTRRLAESHFGGEGQAQDTRDYYYGGSYTAAQSIPPLSVRTEPLKVPGGLTGAGAWRPDLHGDGQSQAPVRAGHRNGDQPACVFHRSAARGGLAKCRSGQQPL
jgi:multiple sugar transport system substrate-binding protein